MKSNSTNNVFERSGLAALSYLNKIEYKELFMTLEKKQQVFLEKESVFRSADYKWPSDSLHNWSRIWEYPYVYYHLDRFINSMPEDSRPIVADVGSGVTFFPFSLAKNGYQVVCTDIDRICEKDLSAASSCVHHAPGSVNFRLTEGKELPFKDSECDALYCISVLEHIPDFENTVSEMARILKPNGLCLITCDINLNPKMDLQLDCEQYVRLLASIDREFNKVFDDFTIHPLDMLTSMNGPYPFKQTIPGFVENGVQLIKQKVIKPLLGRKPGKVEPVLPHWAALGVVLRKKGRNDTIL